MTKLISISAVGISGIDSRGLCIVDPGEDGVIVDQYLHNNENLRRIPIPFVVNELQFYIVKSEKFQTSAPVSHSSSLTHRDHSLCLGGRSHGGIR